MARDVAIKKMPILSQLAAMVVLIATAPVKRNNLRREN